MHHEPQDADGIRPSRLDEIAVPSEVQEVKANDLVPGMTVLAPILGISRRCIVIEVGWEWRGGVEQGLVHTGNRGMVGVAVQLSWGPEDGRWLPDAVSVGRCTKA